METMKKNENTDDLIRAKLENYSVQPPAHLWVQVQQKLEARKRQSRMFWLRVASAAAVVAIAFMAGWYFNGNTQKQKHAFTEMNSPESLQEKDQASGYENENQPAFENSKSDNLIGDKTNGTSLPVLNSISDKALVAAKKDEGQTENTIVNRSSDSMVRLQARNSRFENDPFPQLQVKRQQTTYNELALAEVEKFIIDKNIERQEEEKNKTAGWKMGMFLSPGYSSYNASHSSDYQRNMTYTGKEGNANMGGGISVQYKTGKRWLVESGVYYAQNGQKSERSLNIFAGSFEADFAAVPENKNYFSNTVRVDNGNMAMNSTAGIIAFSETPKGAEITGNFETLAGNSTSMVVPDGQFSQVFEFMEIPLLVRYRVVDARFGVELLSGVSTSVLVGNNAYIDNQFGTQNVGKTLDISSVNLAGIAGIAANYALSDQFSLALEPRFSYYLNSINRNAQVEFRPYRIGVFTGLTYNF